jgi:hypothetical protein
MIDKKRTMIYVPGIKPKPPAAEHHATLWRCLLDGVRRADRATARRLARHKEDFELIGWTDLFYGEKRDLAVDLPGIERLLEMDGPDARDVRESLHWHKRLGRLVYLMCDAFPILIDWVASPEMKANLQDTRRYFRNENKVATRIRRLVTDKIKEAWASGRQIMLIGHSLGSVIAYEVLWELSRREESEVRIDCFVTIGSPLGLNFVKHRLLSAREQGARRYPGNIRHWINLSAIGEMTALDRVFADDYAEMLDLELVENITDHMDLVNYFRGPEGLNVHRCYGYMANEKTGAVVADWWRE